MSQVTSRKPIITGNEPRTFMTQGFPRKPTSPTITPWYGGNSRAKETTQPGNKSLSLFRSQPNACSPTINPWYGGNSNSLSHLPTPKIQLPLPPPNPATRAPRAGRFLRSDGGPAGAPGDRSDPDRSLAGRLEPGSAGRMRETRSGPDNSPEAEGVMTCSPLQRSPLWLLSGRKTKSRWRFFWFTWWFHHLAGGYDLDQVRARFPLTVSLLGEGSPTKLDYRETSGTLILSSGGPSRFP